MKNFLKSNLIKFRDIYQYFILSLNDFFRFSKYNLSNKKNKSFFHYEARITKVYHSIEKGLSFPKIRFHFGKDNLNTLLKLIREYLEEGYSVNQEVYKSTISVLATYKKTHEENNIYNFPFYEQINNLLSSNNIDYSLGGSLSITANEVLKYSQSSFLEFSKSRHSVRFFSKEKVKEELVILSIKNANTAPSACNRQSAKVYFTFKNDLISRVLKYQNGNKGFGNEINCLLIVTADSSYYALPRERNQSFVDGGIFLMNLIYNLHYNLLATVILSAALTPHQEKIIRKLLKISDSDNFISFIGVGNYPEQFEVPTSYKRQVKSIEL
jgi:nitroreductase